MAKWLQKYRADRDATDGGAQQTVWEILMDMERFYGKAKEEDQGAVALVLDLAKAFERVSLLVVFGLGDTFQFPKEVLRAPEASAFRRMRGGATPEEVKKLLRAGMVPARAWRAHVVESSRGIEIEETDGSSSGQNSTTSFPSSWKYIASRWRRNFPPWPLSTGQKESGWGNGIMNKEKLG